MPRRMLDRVSYRVSCRIFHPMLRQMLQRMLRRTLHRTIHRMFDRMFDRMFHQSQRLLGLQTTSDGPNDASSMADTNHEREAVVRGVGEAEALQSEACHTVSAAACGMSIRMPMRMSARMPVHLSARMSVHTAAWPSSASIVHIFLHMPVHMSALLCTHVYKHVFTHVCTHMSVHTAAAERGRPCRGHRRGGIAAHCAALGRRPPPTRARGPRGEAALRMQRGRGWRRARWYTWTAGSWVAMRVADSPALPARLQPAAGGSAGMAAHAADRHR